LLHYSNTPLRWPKPKTTFTKKIQYNKATTKPQTNARKKLTINVPSHKDFSWARALRPLVFVLAFPVYFLAIAFGRLL